jgi:hypothetical protein
VFEEGWLIVQVQYYKLEQVSERGYRLILEKRYLVVNTMIRLKGLVFSRTQGGPQQRELRTTATGQQQQRGRRGWEVSLSSVRTCITHASQRAQRQMRHIMPHVSLISTARMGNC